MLIPLLKTQLLEPAGPQLLEQGYCPRLVGEQVEVRIGIAGQRDRAVVNPVVDPVRRDAQRARDLRHRQAARDATRMRLTALAKQAMTQAQGLDRAGQPRHLPGRPVSLLRQQGRDLLVALASPGQAQDLLLHFRGSRQPRERAHRYRQGGGHRLTAPPDNTDLESIWRASADYNLVDQALPEGFRLSRRQPPLPSQLRDLPARLKEGRPFLGAQALRGGRALLLQAGLLFRLLQLPQR